MISRITLSLRKNLRVDNSQISTRSDTRLTITIPRGRNRAATSTIGDWALGMDDLSGVDGPGNAFELGSMGMTPIPTPVSSEGRPGFRRRISKQDLRTSADKKVVCSEINLADIVERPSTSSNPKRRLSDL